MLDGPPGGLELKWVLSPGDEKLIEDLRDKIKSKMDSAKLLGAFITAVLVFAARELAVLPEAAGWQLWVGGAGLTMLAAATAAYFATMFMYDGLLMPVRMWPSPKPTQRELPGASFGAAQLGRVGPLSEHDAYLVERLRPGHGTRRRGCPPRHDRPGSAGGFAGLDRRCGGGWRRGRLHVVHR